jgi:hypothetical protein
MVQDASDEGTLGNEREELHFFLATRTGQRVDLEDTVNELGPSPAEGALFLEELHRASRPPSSQGTMTLPECLTEGARAGPEALATLGIVAKDWTLPSTARTSSLEAKNGE